MTNETILNIITNINKNPEQEIQDQENILYVRGIFTRNRRFRVIINKQKLQQMEKGMNINRVKLCPDKEKINADIR
jgi:hypothetical protein